MLADADHALIAQRFDDDLTVSARDGERFAAFHKKVLFAAGYGQVVIEALGDESVVRIGQHAESMVSNSQTFAHATYVSVVCPVVRGLRKAADWLDPSPVTARAH